MIKRMNSLVKMICRSYRISFDVCTHPYPTKSLKVKVCDLGIGY